MYEKYRVKFNDTLESIASTYQTTKENLIKLNDIKPIYSVSPNQELKVPRNTQNLFEYYTIKRGDTIYDVAAKHSLTPKELLILNNLNPNNYLYPNQKLLVPKKQVVIHSTKMGDSIDTITKKYNISINDLLLYNTNIYLLPEQIIAYQKPEN